MNNRKLTADTSEKQAGILYPLLSVVASSSATMKHEPFFFNFLAGILKLLTIKKNKMEQTIKDKINSATSMKEAEQFAEKLTYELSYEHKQDSWRTRYEYLRQEDFRKLGWKVFCIGHKTKHFPDWLIEKGFVAHEANKIYYSKEKKEMFMIDDYCNGVLVSIDEWRKGEPTNLLTLDEYKGLLIEKLLILNEAKNKVQAFINGMIKEHKDFLANEDNEFLKTQIINEALEKAREQKLII